MKVISAKFLHFALAGATGFVVDTAVLYAFKGALGPYAARLVSFVAAVFTTWIINRHFAFASHEKHLPLWREFSRYFLAMLAGGAVNFGVYSLLITSVRPIFEHPIIGVALGSLAGMAVNFFLAHSIVFRKVSPKPLQ